MSATPVDRYPLVLRVLHWLLALLLVAQFALGFAAERWTTEAMSEILFPFHFKLGILILCLMILRLALRMMLPLPGGNDGESSWKRRVRSSVHALVYVLVLVLPISGHVIWVWMGADRSLFAGFEVPALFVPPEDETGRAMAWYAHVYGAWTLLALVCVHGAAAAFHQWTRRDGFITRRMGFGDMSRQAGHGMRTTSD